jgi:Ni,Fe-hydrogenase III small subunit/ferredoxin
MLKVLKTRIQQPRIKRFPENAPDFPEHFRGRPTFDAAKCPDGCRACAEACPTDAIIIDGYPTIDLGRCLFCQECVTACPEGAIQYSQDYRLSTRVRQDLVMQENEIKLAQALDEKMRRLFGRSLKLRSVTAGSCNGCDLELQALNNVVFDLQRFGIDIVASPRHADGLIVTGAVSRNMHYALREAYAAVPEPKIVIAVGACAISGGPFRDFPEVHNGVDSTLPVDLYIAGCPPHPITILDGLLRLLGRVDEPVRRM